MLWSKLGLGQLTQHRTPELHTIGVDGGTCFQCYRRGPRRAAIASAQLGRHRPTKLLRIRYTIARSIVRLRLFAKARVPLRTEAIREEESVSNPKLRLQEDP